MTMHPFKFLAFAGFLWLALMSIAIAAGTDDSMQLSQNTVGQKVEHYGEKVGGYIDDSTITAEVKKAFIGDSTVKAMQVKVETQNGMVQLSGFVDSTAVKEQAVTLAQHVKGVKSVYDSILIRTVTP